MGREAGSNRNGEQGWQCGDRGALPRPRWQIVLWPGEQRPVCSPSTHSFLSSPVNPDIHVSWPDR